MPKSDWLTNYYDCEFARGHILTVWNDDYKQKIAKEILTKLSQTSIFVGTYMKANDTTWHQDYDRIPVSPTLAVARQSFIDYVLVATLDPTAGTFSFVPVYGGSYDLEKQHAICEYGKTTVTLMTTCIEPINSFQMAPLHTPIGE